MRTARMVSLCKVAVAVVGLLVVAGCGQAGGPSGSGGADGVEPDAKVRVHAEPERVRPGERLELVAVNVSEVRLTYGTEYSLAKIHADGSASEVAAAPPDAGFGASAATLEPGDEARTVVFTEHLTPGRYRATWTFMEGAPGSSGMSYQAHGEFEVL